MDEQHQNLVQKRPTALKASLQELNSQALETTHISAVDYQYKRVIQNLLSEYFP